jgi:hypothetical protein
MVKQYGKISKVVSVHKDMIVAGDVIVCPDGKERTVCKSNIRNNSLFGVTIFGDSYHGGHKLVQKIQWEFIR